MKVDAHLFSNYVNAVADLVEQIALDEENGAEISDELLLRANDVVLAAHELEELFDEIQDIANEDDRILN